MKFNVCRVNGLKDYTTVGRLDKNFETKVEAFEFVKNNMGINTGMIQYTQANEDQYESWILPIGKTFIMIINHSS